MDARHGPLLSTSEHFEVGLGTLDIERAALTSRPRRTEQTRELFACRHHGQPPRPANLAGVGGSPLSGSLVRFWQELQT